MLATATMLVLLSQVLCDINPKLLLKYAVAHHAAKNGVLKLFKVTLFYSVQAVFCLQGFAEYISFYQHIFIYFSWLNWSAPVIIFF